MRRKRLCSGVLTTGTTTNPDVASVDCKISRVSSLTGLNMLRLNLIPQAEEEFACNMKSTFNSSGDNGTQCMFVSPYEKHE